MCALVRVVAQATTRAEARRAADPGAERINPNRVEQAARDGAFPMETGRRAGQNVDQSRRASAPPAVGGRGFPTPVAG